MRTAIKLSLIILLVVLAAFIIRISTGNTDSPDEKKRQDKTIHSIQNHNTSRVLIEQKWDLPSILKEVSAIGYLDPDRMVCVQDEDGLLFIYNIRSSEIEKEIPFAGPGDYEGLALVGKTAYVLRSDGIIFEIKEFYTSQKPLVTEHKTTLSEKQNTEGLCYDSRNNRLLIAIKGFEPDTKDYKGIYAFDLENNKFVSTPVFKIDLKNDIFKDITKGKKDAVINPSGIALNPGTGDLYIIEATRPKMIIMNKDGRITSLIPLKGKEFSQPEGVIFDTEGNLYISNEGKKNPGNILKVKLL